MVQAEPTWIRGSQVATKHDLWTLKHEIDRRFIEMKRVEAERSRRRWERAVWILLGAYLVVAWTFAVYAFAAR